MRENYSKRQKLFYLRRKLEAKEVRFIIFKFASPFRRKKLLPKIRKIMKKSYIVEFSKGREIAFRPINSIYLDGTFQKINEIVDKVIESINCNIIYYICTYSESSKGCKIKLYFDLSKVEMDDEIRGSKVLSMGFFDIGKIGDNA